MEDKAYDVDTNMTPEEVIVLENDYLRCYRLESYLGSSCVLHWAFVTLQVG